MSLMADVEILAKKALEVAMREKNCTGTMTSHQGGFLSKVRIVAGDPGKFSGIADTGFTGDPIDPASSGA